MSEQYISKEKLEAWIDVEVQRLPHKRGYDPAKEVLTDLRNEINSGTLSAPQAKCFWSSGCSDSARCCAFGSCVAAHQNKHKHEISRPAPHVVGGELLERYEHIRQSCLEYAGMLPGNKSSCYQSVVRIDFPSRRPIGLTVNLASLCDDMMLALNTRPTATQGDLVGALRESTRLLRLAAYRTEIDWQIMSDAIKDRVQKNEAALSASPVAGWMPIETAPNDGSPFLVLLSDEMMHSRVHSATFHPNMKLIGCNFSFDAPNVIGWLPLEYLPPLPPQPSAAEGGEG